MKSIKYVFIGNSQTLKEVGEVPAKANEVWTKEARSIFSTYCKSPNLVRYEQRSKVIGNDGNYFFTITPTNTFYLILADKEYQERQVFQLVEEMQRENVHLLVDEKGELSKLGRQTLKNSIESYENNSHNRIASVSNDIDGIKIEMNQNIKNIVSNLEDAEELKKKSDKIKDSSKEFGKKAAELKRVTCWQNFKWTIILSILVIGILLVIIIPIVVSVKKSTSRRLSVTTGSKDGSFEPNLRH